MTTDQKVEPKRSSLDPARTKPYTVEEARALLGIGRNAIYAAIRAQQIPSLHIGRRLFVPAPVLHRLLGVEPVEPLDLQVRTTFLGPEIR